LAQCNTLGLLERQHTRYFRSVGRFSQRCCDSRAPKLPSDTSQGAQLFTLTTFRKQEQEHQIDWFPVQSIEINRLPKAKKHAKRPIHFRKSRVRYGYAVAHTRGAEFFTLGQLCKYMLWRADTRKARKSQAPQHIRRRQSQRAPGIREQPGPKADRDRSANLY
jgi:hypothetical protein